ncbi:ABC transporter permease [Georgenia yuyongxinii]|uniref:ABC transporter permease n=1 Tax=Georgenia yuyongxinii TaxID=2589797 RepID=A0A5B8C4N9_9MICO|nr:ABC transporter permease [Georgenia yuyongxinii]QDC25554.1 ABC transporter permease [Georgenia yuyongxinii]
MSTLTTPLATRDPDVAVPAAGVKNPWLVVTVREIMVKLTDRSFLISTVITLVMIVAGVGISAYMGSRTTDHTVAVATDAARDVVERAEPAISTDDSGDTLEAVEVADPAAARDAVRAREVDAALLQEEDGWTLVGLDEVSTPLSGALSAAAAAVVLDANAEAAGTTVDVLTAGSAVETELLGANDHGGMANAAGFAFAFLFYMAAIVFGMAIASSVLEEKQNRVVEILATAIPIRQLLYGKVLGNSVLALAQVALYAVVALVAVNVAGMAKDLGWLLGASGWFIVFFIAGFFALASVWAVLGSLASRSEDLQSNTGPVIGIIMVALFAGLFAEGPWLAGASYVPIVSSVAMPIRLLKDDVALWEPVASLLLTVAAAYLLLRLGERIYQRAVMQGGTALTWRQAIRLQD